MSDISPSDNHNDNTYGKTAAEYLAKWDETGRAWSIELGGLGPGYEQAIQLTMFEILRVMVNGNYDSSDWNSVGWPEDRKKIQEAVNPVIDCLGLSGAQFGAALSFAAAIYMKGPQAIILDPEVDDRKIQVSREFPTLKNRAA